MSFMTDFELNHLSLTEEAIFALQGIRHDFPADEVCQLLQQLTEQAMATIDMTQDQDQQLAWLITLFYQQWGFAGVRESVPSNALWLDSVLRSRQGAPVSLGMIFLHLAHQLNIPLQPVIFSTQLILRADWLDEEMWLLDPLNGATLNKTQLERWIKNHSSGEKTSLEESDFDEADNSSVVCHLLNELKTALLNEQQYEAAVQISAFLRYVALEVPRITDDYRVIFIQQNSGDIALSEPRIRVRKYPEGSSLGKIKIEYSLFDKKKKTLH